MNIILLNELVNSDGSRIKGDSKVDQSNNMTTSKLTTDDKVLMQRPGISRYSNYGRVYVGEEDDEVTKLPPKKKSKKKAKLKEDVFTKKDFDKEFVQKKIENLSQNNIQNLDSIRDTNPILIRKVGALKDIIEKNSASGEEKAVILNYLLDMDLSDIPQNYKEILKRKLG
jgi:hypothetical protein